MYDLIEKYLDNILNLEWMTDKSQLAIVGGITINCEGDDTDKFLPLKLEIRTKDGAKKSVLQEAFGKTENIQNQNLS